MTVSSMLGFLINGDQGPLTNDSLKIYDAFSPDGVVVRRHHRSHSVVSPEGCPQSLWRICCSCRLTWSGGRNRRR